MTKKNRSNRSTRGFTLLEVLIAVLIVGIIATAAVPLLGSYTEKAREAREQANIAIKEQALNRYSLDHKAPAGFVWDEATHSYISYGMGTGQGPSAQLLFPSDANGNVQGDPVTAKTGPFAFGPYVSKLPAGPASLLLAVRPAGDIPAINKGKGTDFAWITDNGNSTLCFNVAARKDSRLLGFSTIDQKSSILDGPMEASYIVYGTPIDKSAQIIALLDAGETTLDADMVASIYKAFLASSGKVRHLQGGVDRWETGAELAEIEAIVGHFVNVWDAKEAAVKVLTPQIAQFVQWRQADRSLLIYEGTGEERPIFQAFEADDELRESLNGLAYKNLQEQNVVVALTDFMRKTSLVEDHVLERDRATNQFYMNFSKIDGRLDVAGELAFLGDKYVQARREGAYDDALPILVGMLKENLSYFTDLSKETIDRGWGDLTWIIREQVNALKNKGIEFGVGTPDEYWVKLATGLQEAIGSYPDKSRGTTIGVMAEAAGFALDKIRIKTGVHVENVEDLFVDALGSNIGSRDGLKRASDPYYYIDEMKRKAGASFNANEEKLKVGYRDLTDYVFKERITFAEAFGDKYIYPSYNRHIVTFWSDYKQVDTNDKVMVLLINSTTFNKGRTDVGTPPDGGPNDNLLKGGPFRLLDEYEGVITNEQREEFRTMWHKIIRERQRFQDHFGKGKGGGVMITGRKDLHDSWARGVVTERIHNHITRLEADYLTRVRMIQTSTHPPVR